MNYKSILKLKWPNKVPVQFLDDTYAGIVWNSFDQTPNPTQAELDAAISEVRTVTSVSDGAAIGVYETVKLYSLEITPRSGNTIIPFDNTTPGINEGSSLGVITLTPKSINSKFIINGSFFVDSGTNNRNIVLAVFRNSQCINATVSNVPTSGRPSKLSFNIVDSPLSNTEVVYSFRIGISSSSTWYLNQSSGSIHLNGLTKSNITLLEI